MPAVSAREPTLATKRLNEAPAQPASSSHRPSASSNTTAQSKSNGQTPPSQKKNPPSRERVSAAIALVRARQAAVKASSPGSAATPSNISGASPATILLRQTKSTSASTKPDVYGNRGLSPARLPLSPKPQAQSPKQDESPAPVEMSPTKFLDQRFTNSSALETNSTALTQSPHGSFLLNVFSSQAVALPLPSLALSPQSVDETLVDQENTPRSKNGPASPSRFNANASRGRSRAAAVQLANSRTPTRIPAEVPRKGVQVVQNNVISSAASDDCSVDPDTLADVSRFIDALHQQRGGLSPHAMTGRPSPVIRRPPSDSSDDDTLQIDTQTIAKIGNFIDSIAKPKNEPLSVRQVPLAPSDSSIDTVSIPPQTIEELGSLIDAISKPKANISGPKNNEATGNLTGGVVSPKKEAAVFMLPASPKEKHVAMSSPISPLAQAPLNSSVVAMAISPKTSDAAKDAAAASMGPRPAITEAPSDLTDSSLFNLPDNMDGVNVGASVVDKATHAQHSMVPRSVGTDSDSDDDDDASVPMETRAGIGAFIDALQKKAAMSMPAAPLSPQAAPLSPQAAPLSPQAAPLSPQDRKALSPSQMTMSPRGTDGSLAQGSILEAAPLSPQAAPLSPQAAPLSPQAAPLSPQDRKALSPSQMTLSPRGTDGILAQGSILEVSSSDESCLDPADDDSMIPETEDDIYSFISMVEKPKGETDCNDLTNPRSDSEMENRTGIDDGKEQKGGEHVLVETVSSESADESAMFPVPVVNSIGKGQETDQFFLGRSTFGSTDSDDAELMVFDSLHQINILSLDEVEEGAPSRAPSRAPSCLAGEHLLGGVLSLDLSEEGANPFAPPESYVENIVDNIKSIDEIEQLRALESFESNQRRNKDLRKQNSLFDDDDDDDIGAATIAKISKELAEEHKQVESSAKVDDDGDDEDGDLVAAFLQGSPTFNNPASPLSFRQAILQNITTMESTDNDETIEKFFAKFETPEGVNSEELDRINYYVKQATERSKIGTTPAEREKFIRSMRQSGLPDQVVDQIVVDYFPRPPELSAGQDTRKVIIDEFFSKLIPPQGASKEEVVKFNEFTNVAAPLLQLSKLSLVQEAELRIAAARVGISAKLIDGLLDETESLQRIALTLSVCSSADSEDPVDRLFNEKRFQEMEDIDENENITAFLSRMSALKEGGHFVGKGESTKGPENVAEEADVEIDAHHGFVKKSYQPEEEGDWWTEEGKKGKVTANIRESTLQTIDTDMKEGDDDHDLKPDDPTFSLELDTSLSIKESDSLSTQKPKEKSMEEITAAIENARLARKKVTKVSSSGSVVAIKGEKRRDQKRSQHTGQFDPLENQALVAYNGFQLASPSNIISSMFSSFLSPADRATLTSRKHASKWRNPWEKRWCLGENEKEPRRLNLLIDFDEKPKISGVDVASNLYQKRRVRERAVPVKQLWNATYKERTQDHRGYVNVDVFSLYTAAMVTTEGHDLDDEVWEDREVLQNFLHEKSISFSRNWFGDLIRTRGNERVKLPVAHPKSMEMPMENLPDAGEWDEGWYTTWQTRNGLNGNDSRSSSDSDSGSNASDTYSRGGDTTFFEGEDACSQSFYTEDGGRNRSTYDDDDDDGSTWEEAPECGTLLNVKQKIGERLSRIHPDHTSSLKRSRWRRKYFPQGTFPY